MIQHFHKKIFLPLLLLIFQIWFLQYPEQIPQDQNYLEEFLNCSNVVYGYAEGHYYQLHLLNSARIFYNVQIDENVMELKISMLERCSWLLKLKSKNHRFFLHLLKVPTHIRSDQVRHKFPPQLWRYQAYQLGNISHRVNHFQYSMFSTDWYGWILKASYALCDHWQFGSLPKEIHRCRQLKS